MTDLAGQETAPLHLKAADVRAALKRMFPQPECAIVFEVAQSTGFNAHRHLDAVAMDLWPSRGLALHGIEIKVSIYDFRKEIKTPEKAEQIARFCDYFWIAAPRGIVPVDEVPHAWGLIEIDERGDGKRVKQARQTESHPVTREFMAAMMRASSRIDSDMVDSAIARREKQLQERFDERLKNELERRTTRANDDGERWRNLCAAIGFDPNRLWFSDDELVSAVKAVQASGVARAWDGLRSLHKTLTESAERVGVAIGEIGIPAEAKPAETKRRRSA